MMSVSYIISKYHKISIITITKYLQLVHKKPSFFAQKREIFQKKSIHQTCQGVDLNLDQFDLSAPERFAANVPSCSAALDSLEVQHIHFWWQDLEGQFFEDFLVDFGCICLELIFFNERLCWNLQRDFVGIFIKFRTFHKRFQKLSSNPKNDAEFLEGNGHWRCQNAKNFKRPRLAFRWALHFYRARGRPRSKQRISSFLPISTRMVSREGCVFFFSLEKNNHEVAKEMFGVYIACLKIDLAKTPIN